MPLKRVLLDQPAMVAAARVWRVLQPRDRRIWLGLIVLGTVVAIMEALTAGTALLLVRQLTTTGADVGLGNRLLDDFRTHFTPGLDPLGFSGLIFIGAFTVTMVLTVATLWGEGKLSTRIFLWVGVELLRTYLRADYAWIRQKNSAEFTRNIQESANLFAFNVVLPSARLMRELAVFVAVSVAAMMVRPELAPLTLLLAAIYAVVHWLPYKISDRLGRAGETVKQQHHKALVETYDLLTEIRINGLLKHYVARFAKPRNAYRNLLVFRQLNELVPARVAEWSVLTLIVGFIVLYGHSLRSGPAGEYWLQTIVFALYLAVRLRATLTSLLSNVLSVRFGWAAFLSVEKGLRETPQGYEDNPAARIDYRQSLRVEDVTYAYPNSDAGVANVNVEIKFGEWIGIEGRSGAGKSTFAALIMGLLRPQSGQVLVDGVPVNLNQVAWFANIGFVSQRFAIIDDTLAANITLSPADEIDHARLTGAIKLARLEQVVATIPGGLEGRVGEDGNLLSGGQRQRIALARALYREAKLLVLDEATSALDAETEVEILQDLETLRGQLTLVAIAHRARVLDSCDRVLRFESGRLVVVRGKGEPEVAVVAGRSELDPIIAKA